MILFDIETWPSWQNREQLYILFPQLMCPSDQEKIMVYPNFFLFNYPFNIFVYQAIEWFWKIQMKQTVFVKTSLDFQVFIQERDTYRLHQSLYQGERSWAHPRHWSPPASRFCTESTWAAHQWQTPGPGGSWSQWPWPRCRCGSWARWIFCSS